MAKAPSFGKVEVGLTAGMETSGGTVAEGRGLFRIGILGDFSGRSGRVPAETGVKLAGRKSILVDRDNFDEVMARLNVEIHLPIATGEGGRIAIRFKELDDFRPDRIVQQVEAFQSLRDTRRKLNNPATFADAAAQMHSWNKTAPPAPPPEKAAAASAPMPAPENLLESILGETPSRPSEAASSQGMVDWNAFLGQVVAPFAIPKADPIQAELVAQVDAATGALMRAILHHPDFQTLEAAWRGLFFLVRRLDTDEQLKLYLLDIARAELEADLGPAEDLRPTGMYRLLVEQTVGTPGAPQWAVLAGNYTFGPGHDDVELLGRLARTAQQAGAPFLAAASSAVIGCKSVAATPDPDDWQPGGQEAWQALRRLPEAVYLGLALPRFLLRLPYGKETDPIEGFKFDELPQGGEHEAYLWGNPAVACAYLLGQTFNDSGWGMRPGTLVAIDSLPVHVYTRDGDAETKPCAEAVLTVRAAQAIGEKGVMPLLSVKGSDSVRLGGFRSVADPARPLAGRWR